MTFTQVSERIHKWMCWCPMAPDMRTASGELSTPRVTAKFLEPDGGTGGPGRVYRGVRLAAGSTKFLAKNKRLLWFSFLTGLAILFMFVSVFSLMVYTSYPYPEINYPAFLTLVFAIQLVTLFFLYFLLAGIILNVSSGFSGKPVTVREGLLRTKVHLRAILDWSAMMAILGTVLYAILLQYFYDPVVGLSSLLNQFPFYFVLRPEILGTGPIGGDSHVLTAVNFTLFAMITNSVLFVLAPFVIPAIIFEKKNIARAVRESLALTKKSRAEILSCILVFCLVLLAVSLTSLIFRVAYHLVSFDNVFFWYQGGWIASAALFMIVWTIVALIISTIVGISLAGLYTYAKTGRMNELFIDD
jgi:hypothetical protein